MADAPLVAPSGVTATWTKVDHNGIGTAQVRWINTQGGANLSYGRLDVYVRSRATPSLVYLISTLGPTVTSATISARNGWTAKVAQDWDVQVRASVSGKVAESSWARLDKLVIPTPRITSVQRISADRAMVYVDPAPTGAQAPTALQVSRTAAGQSAGASTQVNQAPMPTTSVSLPLPSATAAYDARVQWVGNAGASGWSSPTRVPAWYESISAPYNLSATRQSSDPSKVYLTWQHAGSGGSAASSFIIERSPDGQVWSRVATTTSRNYTTTLPLTNTSRYRVIAVNGAGAQSSPSSAVTVSTHWSKVPPASDLTASRTASGQIRLGWTVVGETTTNPVRTIYVQRAPLLSGDYVTIDTLSGSARQWVDGSTSVTSEYRYRVQTSGDLGDATSAPTITVTSGQSQPDAPTGVSVARDASNPDTLRVSFTARSSEQKPTLQVRLKARDANGRIINASSLVSAASAGGLLVHAAGPNQIYSYAVEAHNAAGVSLSEWTAPMATTPRGASSLTPTRVGANIQLAWTVAGSTIATGWQIERSSDGGDNWYPIPSPTSDGSARSAVHQNASYGLEHTYRIKPLRQDAPEGAWLRAGASTAAGAAPLTPTATESGWGPVDVPPTLAWVHRPVDGTPQAEARIEWTHTRAGVTQAGETTTVSGDVSQWTAPVTAVVGDHLRWRVATRGTGSGSWSPTSAWRTRQFAARPVVVLSVPETVRSQSLHGSITPPESWVGATVTLRDANGTPVATRQLSPSTGTEFSFPVTDRRTYTVEAILTDGRLESTPQTATVRVAWARPAAPSLTATPIGLTVRLDVTVPYGQRAVALAYRPEIGTDWHASDLTAGRLQVDGVWRDAWQIEDDLTVSPFLPPGGFPSAPGLDQAVSWVQIMAYSDRQVQAGGVTIFLPAGVPVWLPIAGATQFVGTSGAWLLDAATILSDEPAPQLMTPAIPGLAIPGLTIPGRLTQPPPLLMFDEHSDAEGVWHGLLPSGIAYRAVEATSSDEETPWLPSVTVRVELIRVTDGIEHSLGDMADNVGFDMWPRFCAPERYIARAWSGIGAYSDSEVAEATVQHRDILVNYGPGLALSVSAGPRGLTTDGGIVEKVIHSYVGRDYPTAYEGRTQTPHVASVQADLWIDHSPLSEWRAAHNAPGPALFRDPSGMVIHGILTVGQRNHEHYMDRAVAFAMTETEPRP